MQRIYKWLIPGFLRRWDTWLLERYPMVWRTRGHYVLFYALVATLVLFVLGFFYPVSATNLAVDPIMPIILGDENLYIIPLVVLSLGILYWAYILYQTGFPSAKPKHGLLTMAIYGVCMYAIIAVTAPAFYLGTIVHTGYFLMDEADIKYWEENDFFLYGFVLKESDSIYVKPDDAFFQEREATFHKIWTGEEYALTNRYNNYFIDSLLEKIVLKNRFDLWNRSYRPYQSDSSYRSDRWYLWDRSYLWDLSAESNPWDLSDLSFVSYQSNRSDLSFLSFSSSDRSDRSFRSYRLDYWFYYERTKLPQINTSILEKYQIPLRNDSLQIESFMLFRPAYLHDMEVAIRSVHHAQQYLRQWIIFRHWRVLACFLPLLALLLFAAPFLSFRYTLAVVIIGGIGGTGLLTVFELDKLFSREESFRNAVSYLTLPLTGLVLLALSALRKKRNGYVPMAFHLVVLGIAGVLFFAIMGNKWAFAEDSLSMGKPVDLAFFGVQVIGLAGVLLMAYLQALPKRV